VNGATNINGNLFMGRGAYGPILANGYTAIGLTGGNSTGYMYGAYEALGDGMHLSYNFVSSNLGIPSYTTPDLRGHIPNTGGGTSQISLQYSQIQFKTGATAPSTLMTLTTTGLGINCNSPNSSYKLDVNGSGQFTGTLGVLKLSGAADSSSQFIDFQKTNYLGRIGWSGNGSFGPEFSSMFSIYTENVGTSISFIPGSGKLGINCNSPRFGLDVNGTANFNGAVTISNIPQTNILLSNSPLNATLVTSAQQQRLLTTQGASTGIYMTATTSNCLLFAYGQIAPIPFILQPVSGNVGIHNTNPAYPLDVNGAINIRGGGGSMLNIQSTADNNAQWMRFQKTNNLGNVGWGGDQLGGPSYSNIFIVEATSANASILLNSPRGVGINTQGTQPVYTLDVNGTIRAQGTASFSYPAGGAAYAPSGSFFPGATTLNAGLLVSGDILCAGSRGVYVSSDERIKQDINPLLFDSTCQLLQKITPVSYTYKDITKSGASHIGFIAQAVEEICPGAVSHSTEYIPNINTFVSTITTNNTITSYLQISSTLLSSTVQFYTPDKKNIKGTIVSISSNSFDTSMESSIDNYSTLLCQGTYVNDFRVLDKDYIYTLNVTATKKLMELVEQQGSTICGIQQELSTLRG
jgi:hypothetical protein